MYPPTGETSGETFKAYCEAVERARAAEIVRTTGRPTNPLLRPEWGEWTFNHEGKRIVTIPHKDLRIGEFPQATIIAERIARAMARLASEDVDRLRKALESGQKPSSGTDLERLLPDLDRVIHQSLSWVRRAQSSGLDAPMEEADAKEYRDWLTDLGRDDRFEVGYLLSRALKRGMSYAVKYCGGSPKAAALVPPGYMNRLEGEHSLTCTDSTGIYQAPPRRQISAIHHQLLGHAPTSQDVGDRTAKDILLLHLMSDRGVDFMFCDCGEIQFWIDAEDLIARRFDCVRANTEGG
jgi:hypothetical protein